MRLKLSGNKGMKKVSRSFKIIVDTNIWISFLIGKTLKGLQNYLDNKTVIIITCKEQIQELTLVFEKPKMKKYFTPEQIVEFFELLDETSHDQFYSHKQMIIGEYYVAIKKQIINT